MSKCKKLLPKKMEMLNQQDKKYDKTTRSLITNYFVSCYLALISLLQGIAIYLFTDYCFEYIFMPQTSMISISLSQIFFIIIIMCFMWHHYVLGVIYLRWIPGILDTIIPIFLGVFELSMIMQTFIITNDKMQNITRFEYNKYNIMIIGILLIIAGFAYLNASIKHNAKYLKNIIKNSHHSKNYSKKIKTLHYSMGSLCLLWGSINLICSIDAVEKIYTVNLILSICAFSFYEIYYFFSIRPFIFNKPKQF